MRSIPHLLAYITVVGSFFVLIYTANYYAPVFQGEVIPMNNTRTSVSSTSRTCEDGRKTQTVPGGTSTVRISDNEKPHDADFENQAAGTMNYKLSKLCYTNTEEPFTTPIDVACPNNDTCEKDPNKLANVTKSEGTCTMVRGSSRAIKNAARKVIAWEAVVTCTDSSCTVTQECRPKEGASSSRTTSVSSSMMAHPDSSASSLLRQ